MTYTLECLDDSGWSTLVGAGDKLIIISRISELIRRGVDYKSLRVFGWKEGKQFYQNDGKGYLSVENFLNSLNT